VYNHIFTDRRVLVTGHTGFKGSWLTLWLQQMGSEVFWFSLPPETDPNHYSLLHQKVEEALADIRDAAAVARWVKQCRPEIVFHLAAQPLVRRSYRAPLYTHQTNIIGTANLLEACRASDSVKAIVLVTSDKCYRNMEQERAFKETDPLGGHDPYSASKACAELIAASYRSAFFRHAGASGDHPALIATCRSGNVIGGGDWAEDRLVPDLVRAAARNQMAVLRNPGSIRPWQHVLDPLSGYLQIAQLLFEGDPTFADGWNFGPNHEQEHTVEQVAGLLQAAWPAVRYHAEPCRDTPLHEASTLKLDCAKARSAMGWQPVWDSTAAVARTAKWYERYFEHHSVCSGEDLQTYIADAAAMGRRWASEKAAG
jgi:CDP-glucose 4,6-dehydratase